MLRWLFYELSCWYPESEHSILSRRLEHLNEYITAFDKQIEHCVTEYTKIDEILLNPKINKLKKEHAATRKQFLEESFEFLNTRQKMFRQLYSELARHMQTPVITDSILEITELIENNHDDLNTDELTEMLDTIKLGRHVNDVHNTLISSRIDMTRDESADTVKQRTILEHLPVIHEEPLVE